MLAEVIGVTVNDQDQHNINNKMKMGGTGAVYLNSSQYETLCELTRVNPFLSHETKGRRTS